MKKLVFLFICLLSLFSCRKDKDAAPRIDLTSPLENEQYDVFSDIPVTGTVYDNNQLTNVKIVLTDLNCIPVLPAVEIKPGSNTLTLNQAYTLSDIHLKTADYYMQVQAGDGAQVTNKFVRIRINAVPKKLKFLLAVTRTGSQLHILKIDSLMQVSQLFNVTSDYLGSGCSSDWAQFYLCGSIYGDLSVYDITTWQINWSVPVTSSPPFPWFVGLMIDKGYCWIGYREGSFEKYNPQGTPLLSISTATGWSPLKFCISGDKLLIEEKSYAGAGQLINMYYEPTGAPLGNYFSNDVTAAFIPLSGNEICHLTNDQAGNSHLYIFSTNSVNESEISSSFVPGKVLCAAPLGDDVLIGQEAGVYRYVEQSASLIRLIDGIHASALCYDEAHKQYYIAEYKTLRQYNDLWPADPYAHLNSTITLNDTILALHAVYNRD